MHFAIFVYLWFSANVGRLKPLWSLVLLPHIDYVHFLDNW